MSSMTWYPLPQSGSTLSTGDEFFENQSTGWSLWSFSISDDQNTAYVCSDKHENGAAQCSTGRSEEQSEGQAPLELEFTQRTEDIFLSQFSDEEMRKLDVPFEALDMFPDSMHNLLSYENMLSGVLTGSECQETKLDQNGIDTMDTCGFPLFSHDLQNDLRNADGGISSRVKTLNGSEIPADPPSRDKAGVSMTKRSRSVTDTESTPGFEVLVLEELEDVVFQLTKKTRICVRDAFYRLAESSKPKCTADDGATESGSSRQSFQHPQSSVSRVSAPGGCPERETNAIDRTVADLTLKLPCSAPQCHENCCADDSAAEAQSTSSWITRA
ncbi:uncharacterized protein LOC133899736 isoform X2 [Phragmites australis]|uniref:uncharacterized protein LOC133899736 isoform X2 n=1 Tax=Phragmites australis TaxID=29695 RepID=UPI002D795BCE|nr:uncharacterized protein LOC133899736 isoform X2 [Phragmites australis]